MQVTFLEKQYTNTSHHHLYLFFKNDKSPLIIHAKYKLIELYTEPGKSKRHLFTIKANYLIRVDDQLSHIQDLLDQHTHNILIEIEKQINFHNKIVEDYKKISNGLCYFI
jgi:hypothetical protein